jgi:hypothetical protein
MGQSPQSAIEMVCEATPANRALAYAVRLGHLVYGYNPDVGGSVLPIFVCSRADMLSLLADFGDGSVKDNKLQ